MEMNTGKQFEIDFKNSCPSTAFIYRFRDSASSFYSSEKTRFTPSNICDYMIYDDNTRILFLLELKTTRGSSLSLNNIRDTQIKQLTNASKHNIQAGFIVNFREKNNYTAYLHISKFNKMIKNIGKKSFNIEDMVKADCIEIESQIKRTHYSYNLKDFLKKVKGESI